MRYKLLGDPVFLTLLFLICLAGSGVLLSSRLAKANAAEADTPLACEATSNHDGDGVVEACGGIKQPTEGVLIVGDQARHYQRFGTGEIPLLYALEVRFHQDSLPAAFLAHVTSFVIDSRFVHPTPQDKAQPFTLDDCAEELHLQVEALYKAGLIREKKVLLFGQSFLPSILFTYADRYPEEVLGIIATGTPPRYDNSVFDLAATTFASFASPKKQAYFEACKAYSPAGADRTAKRQYLDGFAVSDPQWHPWKDLPALESLMNGTAEPKTVQLLDYDGFDPDIDQMRRFFGGVVDAFDPSILERLNMPVLIINGISDMVAWPYWRQDSALLEEQLPDTVWYVEIGNEGHYPWLTNPQLFTAICEGFLRQLK